jgi:SNF2 family DNA or RNA helicase
VLFEANKLPAEKRAKLANRIRTVKDINLPELKYFNSSPCAKHENLDPACQQCGVVFRKHQKVGVSWLYSAGMGLLADSVGTGKTIQAAGVMAVMKEAGELESGKKILVVCRPTAADQWAAQVNRLTRDMKVIIGDGVRAKRLAKYEANDWQILVMGYQMLINDLENLSMAFEFQAMFVDDVDPLINDDTATAYAINRMAGISKRNYILTGTPLQKKLHNIYNALKPLGIRDVLGSPITFERRYVQKMLVNEASGTGKVTAKKKIVGYQNLDEFKEKISPFVLRRTAADIDDVNLPAITPSNVFLEPYPAQMAKYQELREGVLRIIKAEGEQVKHAQAVVQFLYGAQICGGLAVIGEEDRPRTSIKLDWVEDKLTGDLSDEKVVVFIHFRNGIKALQNRLDNHGIRYVTISGASGKGADRFGAVQEFWNNPDCKVLIGSTSIEQSLNLQISRHLINVDMIMNPSRMEQLAGRIRRDGSAYGSVYVHNLLTVGTQEEKYLPALQREQALIDHIWDSQSELFDALSPLELLQMIGGSGV